MIGTEEKEVAGTDNYKGIAYPWRSQAVPEWHNVSFSFQIRLPYLRNWTKEGVGRDKKNGKREKKSLCKIC